MTTDFLPCQMTKEVHFEKLKMGTAISRNGVPQTKNRKKTLLWGKTTLG